ncbi:putative lipid II flippase FtsW [Compostimonas suwonensis]|uniref:Probable peptidoglycan glycosyltransferase FtsW n=1 Tax=Compostimonas suwonensis TaxID=1048394 RepID=A0A2M9BAX7_9MICO|nr:putative lipid II flippase FtsW [Compostimonas suwonensis]PJJ55093.1 cell division protein FtsW [Compostimonas suwonensis]
MTSPPRSAPTASRLFGRSRGAGAGPSGDDTAATGAGAGTATGTGSSARISLGRLFRAETANYFLLLGTTLFLVALGLVMVLSSSSVDSYLDDDGFFGGFWRQALYAGIGVPLMLVISRFPPTFWKRWALPLLAFGAILQLLVLVTPLGYEIGGNKNWLRIGAFTAQPSEALKVALIVWLGVFLARRIGAPNQTKQILMPIAIVGGGSIALVLAGGDLGTVIIMAGIVVGALFFAGVRLRILALPIVLGAIAAAVVAISSPNRLQRIEAFFSEDCTDYANSCWQIQHGYYAMANGGIFGVGLGNSKAKWSWLPAADNDFIFAIIGEELGLLGAIVVLALFILLAVSFVRIMHAQTEVFPRVVTGGILVWIIGQACVNIGVVLGVIPVLGVPLPLISSGGTALITSLVAIGIVLSFARQPARLPGEVADAATARPRRKRQPTR